MNATTYGLDIAKSVFQLYWVNPQSGEIFNRRFSRDQLIRFLSGLAKRFKSRETCRRDLVQSFGLRPLGAVSIRGKHGLHALYEVTALRSRDEDAGEAPSP